LNQQTAAHPALQKFFFMILICLSMIVTLSVARAKEAITFPPLTGEFAVGQAEYYLMDEARPEIFTDDPDDVRELMTTIYYPAEVTDDAQPAPYGDDALMAEASQWPGIDAERWSQIETDLLSGVPFAPGQETHPIIVFSPGFGVLPLYYTSLLAEIASHGYVVISISRTYSTALTVFPEGRLIRSNDAGTDIDPREGDTYFDALEKRVQVGDVWVADIRFMLDQLEGLNREDPLLGGHLDLTRIGLVGHSFGGSASAQAAYLDNRVGAVIDMDSYLDYEVAHEGLSQPYLYMEEAYQEYEDPDQMPTDEQLAEIGITRDDLFSDVLIRSNHINLLEGASAGYRLRLEGAQHLTFTTDLHVFAPHFPGRIGQQQTGTMDGERALQVIRDYSVAFFDQHLTGQDSPLLDGTPGHDPDVQFESY
jgi:hypothetical protein